MSSEGCSRAQQLGLQQPGRFACSLRCAAPSRLGGWVEGGAVPYGCGLVICTLDMQPAETNGGEFWGHVCGCCLPWRRRLKQDVAARP